MCGSLLHYREMRLAFFSIIAPLSLVSCGEQASAEFPVGVEVEIAASELALPAELRLNDAMGPVVAEVPCGAEATCPALPGVPIDCMEAVCDPSPQRISVPVGDIIDLDELAGDLADVLRRIDTIEILSIDYQVDANTLTVDVPAIDVYWGPRGAVAIDAGMGTRRLATLPRVPAATTAEGTAMVHLAGSAAFSEHFETTSHRFRLFAETMVDLEPGEPFPEGAIRISVRMRVRVSGSVL